MKFRNLLLAVAGFAGLMLSSCKKDQPNTGAPSISVDPVELTFEKESGSQDVNLTATRDWNVTKDADWVTVSAMSGKASASAQKITVTVMENTGTDREANLTFDIGFAKKVLVVKQKGSGSAADALVYFNNFDKTAVVKGEKGYPYLDQSEDWKNQTGTGAANVEYSFMNASVRSNSASSNTQYSAYSGSGVNNIFFGKVTAYLQIKNIMLPEARNYILSFGTEKYLRYAPDNTVTKSEFHVYISNDGAKWVELDYKFPGELQSGKWDLATAKFSVPAGVDKLQLAFVSDKVASAFRVDDVKLEIGGDGAAVDFSTGMALELGGGSSSGGTTPEQPSGDIITVASIQEFLALAPSTSQLYRITGVVTNIANTTYGNLSIKDDTGELFVYGVKESKESTDNKSFYKTGIVVNDTITIVGFRNTYTPKTGGDPVEQMKDSYLESRKAYAVPTNPGDPENPGDQPVVTENMFTSVVKFVAGENGYVEDQVADITYQGKTYSIEKFLKLGTSKKVGSGTAVIPAGTKSITFYAYAWKATTDCELSVKKGSEVLKTVTPSPNDGVTGNPKYSITVNDNPQFTVDFGGALAEDTTIEFTATKRVVIFGLKLVK